MSTQVLEKFVPLNELTQENLRDLASKTPIEKLPKGKALFRKGDRDNYSYYLLSGELIILGDEEKPSRIVGGTAPSRFPLDHHRPRNSTAIADSDVTYFRIDNDLLDILLTWDQNAGYMVSEIDVAEEIEDNNGVDWMTMMLRSEIFHRIPPSNIQQVFMRMEPVQYQSGDRVINQGDEGDYYYFIKAGRVLVTHVAKSGKEIKLAELEAGNGFGEEALISDNRRNANVTMLDDGVLMRMGKEDFVELLKAPVLHNVDYGEAQGIVNKGEAVWLDVRLESEYRNMHIPGSLNIPLYLLRIKAGTLDKKKRYIVYCDTGRRSSSAAFLLNERGYDACYLDGGLRGLEREQLGGLKRAAV
ncbi:MAG: cyclic nucleotide-binding domain-containing protein [Gammaproteobacteria bacterium]|nr:cyclic nucleotide-binding domain-containing protein [Gammaproteobacteria bacterium]MCW8840540.1 cyclic nucleotide-binding domain-containing protein [Gammaproteobacteria bacterium]MCW8927921.1 cyclic nucleotide-binding domain-containing protein [Gammaproteobacteria bacterium]MCW8958042.1 cyclic nucleotide-binding domain-containing protein [Gammaproteobacteria bacterium]MCW8991804.1 cyclic nucleotide-binding domain-containing protein [Gammaproteobacteria bacterium]